MQENLKKKGLRDRVFLLTEFTKDIHDDAVQENLKKKDQEVWETSPSTLAGPHTHKQRSKTLQQRG